LGSFPIADWAPIRSDKGEIKGMEMVFREVIREYQLQQEASKNEGRLQTVIFPPPQLFIHKF